MGFNFSDPLGLVKGAGSFLHPERGYEKASRQLGKSWDEAKGFQQPYSEHGLEMFPQLSEIFKNLLDPTKLQGDWMKSYEQSPMAKQFQEQNTNMGRDEASAMGLSGSSAALGNIQQGAGNIAAQDKQQFIQNMMKQYLEGLGLGKDIYNTGAQTAGNLGDQAMGHGRDMAGAAFGQTNAPGETFGDLFKMGKSIFGGGMF